MHDETEKESAAPVPPRDPAPEAAEAVAREDGDAPRGGPAPEEDDSAASPESPGGGLGPGTARAEATLGDVLLAVEELWPASLAEKWDRVGLVAGRTERPVKRVLFAVDPTLDVARDAVARGTDLLITHHPLMLRGVNSVAATDAKGEVVHELIEGRCALLTVHTNGDSAVGGVSDVLSDIFGLQDVEPLSSADEGLPEEGIGRVGDLPQATTLGDFASKVFGAMPSVAGGVRVAGDRQAVIRRVAVCGGAGDSLFDVVRAAGADVYITGDLRHHPALEARETARGQRPYLIDVSHFASEWLWLPAAAEALNNVLTDQNFDAEVQVSGINTDPWDFVLTPQ